MVASATRSHAKIRAWARSHGATPVIVSRTAGMLRLEFPPRSAVAPQEANWEEFFQVFDEKGLELIHDDQPGSRFHKLAYPETVAAQKPVRGPVKIGKAGKGRKRQETAGRAAA